jgi:uncharacterized protein (DUF2235 family)
MPKKFKHLVILIDGTWNSAAEGRFRDSTNIFRLTQAINTEDRYGNPQITFYMPGPGTRGWVDRPFGGLFGAGIDEIIREAYVNIASNYNEADDDQQPDRIYLFGFSRGGIVAHALSSLISRCGLLHGKCIDELSRVWGYFLDQRTDPNFHEEMADSIACDASIEMLGIFDAVLGRLYRRGNVFSKIRFPNYKLDADVKFGIQILAADDNRRRFSPAFWEGVDDDAPAQAERIQQIWLPGVHSDIGGIPREDNSPSFLSDVALLTMIEHIRAHTELSIDDEYIQELLGGLSHLGRIDISNERQTVIMKGALYSKRRTCRELLGETVHVGEKIHPLYDIIHGRRIEIRGRRKVYTNSRIDEHKSVLPRYETEWERTYAEECERIIRQMR